MKITTEFQKDVLNAIKWEPLLNTAKIEVKLSTSWSITKVEITTDLLAALKLNWSVAQGKVTSKLENGSISLEGKLPWNYHAEAASRIAWNTPGIWPVNNELIVDQSSFKP